MRNVLLVAITLMCMSMSCRQVEKNNAKEEENNNCENVMCTEIFMSVTLRVVDGNDKGITLDEFYTVNTSANDTFRSSDGLPAEGYYPVLDDSYRTKLRNKTQNFHFVGIKGGKKIVDEDFKISADCCHIGKQSGRDSVVVK